MSFAIFSDSACNLPRAQLEEFQVQIIPFSYERDGMLVPCPLTWRNLTAGNITTISATGAW